MFEVGKGSEIDNQKKGLVKIDSVYRFDDELLLYFTVVENAYS
jgi:hypothetical protein